MRNTIGTEAGLDGTVLEHQSHQWRCRILILFLLIGCVEDSLLKCESVKRDLSKCRSVERYLPKCESVERDLSKCRSVKREIYPDVKKCGVVCPII